MEWSARKCEYMAEGAFHIQQERINQVDQVTYLGVTLDETGTKDVTLIKRVETARQSLRVLRRATKDWNLQLRQRRNLCQTFVFSKVELVTYLQLLSGLMRKMSRLLENQAAQWILRVRVAETNTN